jgi:hypothetical protein
MDIIMLKFKDRCNLLSVHNIINNTQISISKPKIAFAKYYFYHTIKGYSIVAQVIIKVRRRFIDIMLVYLKTSMTFEFLPKKWIIQTRSTYKVF